VPISLSTLLPDSLDREERFLEGLVSAYGTFPRFLQPTSLSKDEAAPVTTGRRYQQIIFALVHCLTYVFKVLVNVPLGDSQLTRDLFSRETCLFEERGDAAANRVIPFFRDNRLSRFLSTHHHFLYVLKGGQTFRRAVTVSLAATL
jgi:hypothetical protein